MQPDNPNGCPSVGIVLAYVGARDLATDNVTVLLCSQKIQEVQVEVRLRGDETGRIGADSLLAEPVTAESTAKYLTNGTDGIESFNYRVEPHFAKNLSDIAQGNAALDHFFGHLASGSNGTALEDITGRENTQALIDAVNVLYKRYMVQVFNTLIFHRSLNSSEQRNQLLNGTANATASRLTVDFTSKLVLQIMLATMVWLEALALSQIKLRGLLPRNPWPIASIMAFLAGSNMSHEDFMPEGAERMNTRQLNEAFDKYTFGLGWRHNDDSTPAQNSDEGRNDEDSKVWRFGIDVGQAARFGVKLKQEE
jgi:hypothetical protein